MDGPYQKNNSQSPDAAANTAGRSFKDKIEERNNTTRFNRLSKVEQANEIKRDASEIQYSRALSDIESLRKRVADLEETIARGSTTDSSDLKGAMQDLLDSATIHGDCSDGGGMDITITL